MLQPVGHIFVIVISEIQRLRGWRLNRSGRYGDGRRHGQMPRSGRDHVVGENGWRWRRRWNMTLRWRRKRSRRPHRLRDGQRRRRRQWRRRCTESTSQRLMKSQWRSDLRSADKLHEVDVKVNKYDDKCRRVPHGSLHHELIC